jgi:hypothetical protein
MNRESHCDGICEIGVSRACVQLRGRRAAITNILMHYYVARQLRGGE